MKTGYDLKIQELKQNIAITQSSSKIIEHSNPKAFQEYQKRIELLQEQIKTILQAKKNSIK
jgi:ATP phosphoribosyltransferase